MRLLGWAKSVREFYDFVNWELIINRMENGNIKVVVRIKPIPETEQDHSII